MKKIKAILVSTMLLISIVLSFTSCNIFSSGNKRPEGYTGGFLISPLIRSDFEIYWFETFEEVMYAIEHLEAAGNRISQNIISSYENETVDAKYYIKVDISHAERKKKGQEWYDRKYSDTTVGYFGFLDKITIEELEYSYFYDYRLIAVYVYTYELDNIKYIDLSNDITYRCSACQELEYEYEKHNVSEIITKDKKGKVADMSYYGIDYCKDLPENFHEEFIKTLVYMGEKP